MRYAIAYAATSAVFFTVDLIWLGWIARGFYRAQLGALLLERFNMSVAAAFYAVFVVGIVIFAVAPALNGGGWRTALVFGALFGFFAYATYDMTNLATLKGWPVSITLLDIAWGTFLTGFSALCGYLITVAMLPR